LVAFDSRADSVGLAVSAIRNNDPINALPPCRPEILKHEMKVFFVKYNDPIYVKLEKLDIMIRLASQANIAQVTTV